MRIRGNGLVGIGTDNPSATLDVNGSLRSGSVTTPALTITTGGEVSDFIIKSNTTGDIGFRKGNAAVGLNYIICIQGEYPSENPPPAAGPILGEIKLVCGNVAPYGWVFCNGQLMAVNLHMNLFTLIGTTYGGNGVTTFQLPDMRNTVPVGQGSNWALGERSN
jgi:microcystin-dependent protein